MAAFLPHKKGFAGYASRFVDPALGFALGWNYLLKYVSGLSLLFGNIMFTLRIPLSLSLLPIILMLRESLSSIGLAPFTSESGWVRHIIKIANRIRGAHNSQYPAIFIAFSKSFKCHDVISSTLTFN